MEQDCLRVVLWSLECFAVAAAQSTTLKDGFNFHFNTQVDSCLSGSEDSWTSTLWFSGMVPLFQGDENSSTAVDATVPHIVWDK